MAPPAGLNDCASRVRANAGLSSTRGSAVVGGWHDLVVEVTIADTRNASRTACPMSGLPSRCGYPIRCSVPPGRRCSRSASGWLIMTACGSAGSKMRPASDLDPVRGHALAARGARLGHQAREGRRARDRQGHLQERRGSRRRHLRKAGDGAEVAVEPGLRRADQQVGGMAAAQEARIGGVGAPRARGGGQRDAADQAEQHGQGQHRPPLPAQFGAQPQPDRSHVRHSAPAPRRSRMQASPPAVVLPARGPVAAGPGSPQRRPEGRELSRHWHRESATAQPCGAVGRSLGDGYDALLGSGVVRLEAGRAILQNRVICNRPGHDARTETTVNNRRSGHSRSWTM